MRTARTYLWTVKTTAPVAASAVTWNDDANGAPWRMMPRGARRIIGITLNAPAYAVELHWRGQEAGELLFDWAHTGSSIFHPLDIPISPGVAWLCASGTARNAGQISLTLLLELDDA